MENSENTNKEILERLIMLEEKLINYQIGEMHSNKIEKPKVKGKGVILKIVFRALSVAIVTFAIGFVIMSYFEAKNNDSNKTQLNMTEKKDTVATTPKVINNPKKIGIVQSIDSLNILLIQEVSGSGASKKAGYGPKAQKLKLEIDSLRNKLKNQN